MNLEAKMQDPICINSNVILTDENYEQEYPLLPDVLFGKKHFRFVLICDNNWKQREYIYSTQNRIEL